MQGGRPVRVVVRLTAREHQAVLDRSIAAGLTVPSYLALCGLRPNGVAAADVKSALTNARGARRLLAGAANNLNQLTAKLHATGHVDPALPAALAAVERIAARVDDDIARVADLVTGARR